MDGEWQAADIGASLQSKRRVPVLNVENVCTQATLTYKEHRSGGEVDRLRDRTHPCARSDISLQAPLRRPIAL